jgi:hypothetical protein
MDRFAETGKARCNKMDMQGSSRKRQGNWQRANNVREKSGSVC